MCALKNFPYVGRHCYYLLQTTSPVLGAKFKTSVNWRLYILVTVIFDVCSFMNLYCYFKCIFCSNCWDFGEYSSSTSWPKSSANWWMSQISMLLVLAFKLFVLEHNTLSSILTLFTFQASMAPSLTKTHGSFMLSRPRRAQPSRDPADVGR